MEKQTFVLKKSYQKVISELSDAEAGLLFKAVLAYHNDLPIPPLNIALNLVFTMMKTDFDYNIEKYNQICTARAEAGRKGGLQTQLQASQANASGEETSKPSKSKHNDSDSDSDSDSSKDKTKQQLLTAGKPQGIKPPKEDKSQKEKPKQPRKLNALQEFASKCCWLFEPDDMKKTQMGIWFKRNCRDLADILKYCGGNEFDAVGTIDTGLDILADAGFKDVSYAAIVRHIQRYLDAWEVRKQAMRKKQEKANGAKFATFAGIGEGYGNSIK